MPDECCWRESYDSSSLLQSPTKINIIARDSETGVKAFYSLKGFSSKCHVATWHVLSYLVGKKNRPISGADFGPSFARSVKTCSSVGVVMDGRDPISPVGDKIREAITASLWAVVSTGFSAEKVRLSASLVAATPSLAK